MSATVCPPRTMDKARPRFSGGVNTEAVFVEAGVNNPAPPSQKHNTIRGR
jgi:hypothetical protein